MNGIETNSISFVILQKFIKLGLLKVNFINNSEVNFAEPLIQYLVVQKHITKNAGIDNVITLSKIVFNPFTFLGLGLFIAYMISNIQYLYLIFGVYILIEVLILGTLLKNHIIKQVHLSESWFDALYLNGDIVIDSTAQTRQVFSDMEIRYHLKYPIDWREKLKFLIEEGVLPIIDVSTSS